ncbi:MAG: Nucleotidyltransferase substrate binding protein, HI0074 family [Candidatus Amesbacteria bacterium GW2011_GWA2_42_12]|uniref:Nucleotidyltransferase substrate binding protein, HI0074 family n=1 Tax=Candidatus Amesbacteria bacterium GW2011_GWA2_42_12 TaxID=1618356 RepID=A0A0G1B3Z7_9BACT|nr:MAG: Nucleotidyltransferase substrate binding protein, HI0074 family [Candidatus Amesbacteria bacterium GW2011_GWA2_42_12]
MNKFEEVKSQFEQALIRLEEALAQPKNDFMRDSCIQRFEFTLDLAWKTVQIYLKDVHGIDCNSPKTCFREAFRVDLIEYDDFWIEMVDKRNETVHTYVQELAEKVYEVLPHTVTLFHQLLAKLTH